MHSTSLTSGLTTLVVLLQLFASQSHAQDPEVSPNGHATIWFPTAQGPNDTMLSINVIDVLLMSYDSKWRNVNASIWCLTDNATGRYTGQPLINPMAGRGNYEIKDLNQGIGATQFPLPCHFALMDTYNASDTFAGGTYLMVSTQGAAVTRSYSVPRTSSSREITSPTGSTTSSSSSTARALPSVTGSGSNQDGDNEGHSNGLSGPKIAAVVVCSVIVAGLAGGLLWWILQRRKSRRGKVEIQSTASEQTNIHEVDSRRYGPELSGSGAPALSWLARRELPASTWASDHFRSPPSPPVVHEMAPQTSRASPT